MPLRECPLCGTELEANNAKAVTWLAPHLSDQHLLQEIRWRSSAVLCTCQKHFRGLRSWSAHIASLEGEDLAQHVMHHTAGVQAEIVHREPGLEVRA